LIRDLTNDDVTVRDRAFEGLREMLNHQFSVYEATSYAIPFLIELLTYPHIQDKMRLLGLLYWFSVGSSSHEPAYQQRCYEAAREGIPAYRTLLTDVDQDVQWAAAQMLSRFKDRIDEISDWFFDAIESENTPLTQARWIVEFACFLVDSPSKKRHYETRFVKLANDLIAPSQEFDVRLFAATALAEYLRSETPRHVEDFLLEINADLGPGEAFLIFRTIANLGDDRALPVCVKLLESARTTEQAFCVVSGMLNMYFKMTCLDLSLSQLTDSQRTVLELVVTNDLYWQDTIAGSYLASYGPPNNREELIQWLS
jgi:hypothetical protein